MPTLKGHIDHCNKRTISGWVIDTQDPARRVEVEIFQAGHRVASVVPRFRAETLRRALGLDHYPDPIYLFNFPFPLALGVRPDEPFDIRITETGEPLALGAKRVVKLAEGRCDKAIEVLQRGALLFPHPSIQPSAPDLLELGLRVSGAECEITVHIGEEEEMPLRGRAWVPDPLCLNKPTTMVRIAITAKQLEMHPGYAMPVFLTATDREEGSVLSFHEKIRTISVPKTVFDKNRLAYPVPDDSNIARVSGPSGNRVNYLVGGATTFRQLDALVKSYFDRPIASFRTIVDWGVGCGRVMRQFHEDVECGSREPKLIGIDIDPVNVEWCSEQLCGLGDIRLCARDGFDLRDSSVDLLYGISVMTHLSEYYQGVWLQEISRVLRPGGVAILTTHGELATYQAPQSVGLPFFEQFGFFDGFGDTAIGEQMSSYYRTTTQDALYVRDTWERHLAVVDIIPAANAFRQDFVVLQKGATP
jgi:SAM-dependent methyltransferase